MLLGTYPRPPPLPPLITPLPLPPTARKPSGSPRAPRAPAGLARAASAAHLPEPAGRGDGLDYDSLAAELQRRAAVSGASPGAAAPAYRPPPALPAADRAGRPAADRADRAAAAGQHPHLYYPAAQRELTYRPPGNAAAAAALPESLRAGGACFVILFGVGRHETEGIYTLRTQECVDGAATNVDTALAFESEVDAARFATLLAATLDHEPTVSALPWADMAGWCDETNSRCWVERAGSLLLPPHANLPFTDWERALRLEAGQFSVLEAEPARAAQPGGFFIEGPEWALEEAGTGGGAAARAARAALERSFNMSG
jgi:hypothetical protein